MKEIVAKMVLSNPGYRPTAEELLDHPWLKGGDILASNDTEPDTMNATFIDQTPKSGK